MPHRDLLTTAVTMSEPLPAYQLSHWTTASSEPLTCSEVSAQNTFVNKNKDNRIHEPREQLCGQISTA